MRHRVGFTLIELLLVISIITLLLSILLPGLASARRLARQMVCQTQMRDFGVATGNYANDYKELIWTFSWRAGRELPTEYADLRGPEPNHLQAATNQMVDILRRRGEVGGIDRVTFLVPHVLYSHLVILDYKAAQLPAPGVVCPEDKVRAAWARDPEGFQAGRVQPAPDDATEASGWRWPFGSSYQAVPAVWDRSQQLGLKEPLPIQRTCNISHFFYFYPNFSTVIGPSRISNVRFPAQKVHMHDSHQRHEREEIYFGVSGAKQPLLFFDGSVSYRSNKECNLGWYPRSQLSPLPHVYPYIPAEWEAPTTNGQARESVIGYYRWTRGGLAGIDYGAREINTGQPRD